MANGFVQNSMKWKVVASEWYLTGQKRELGIKFQSRCHTASAQGDMGMELPESER